VSPTPRALGLLALWLAAGVLASFAPDLTAAWVAAGVAVALALLGDALWLWRRSPPEVERQVPAALSTGSWTTVRLRIENPGRARLRLRAYDHHPPRARVRDLPVAFAVPPGHGEECAYRLWPEARGRHRFGRVELRLRSALGLVERHLHAGAPEDVRVYPNFRAAAGYELLAAENRTGALGIRRRPRRGEGLEFHQLREYREGDALRQIDWKATARLGRPISREYQDERDQQVVFLLDCGRRLHAQDDGRAHFDSALDSLLLLAHVAIRQGDAVGLLTFSGPRRWLAPRKGVGQLNALLNAVFDLETSTRSVDFQAAAREVAVRVRRRALIVLISNVRDEDTEELVPSLRLLSKRHLVLLASLREGILSQTLRTPVRNLETALRVGAVHRYLEDRTRGLRSAERSGALLLDCESDELSTLLVNGYLDVKASGVL
jgi:uncharacterized protein (DUF58 family)